MKRSSDDRKCEDCGTDIRNRAHNTSRCYDCAEKHKKEYQRKYRTPERNRRYQANVKQRCLNPVPRLCATCKVSIECRANNAVYCLECAEKRRLEQARKYRAKDPDLNKKALERYYRDQEDPNKVRRRRQQQRERNTQDRLENNEKHKRRIARGRKYYHKHAEEINRQRREDRARILEREEERKSRPPRKDTWRPFVVPDYLKVDR